MKEAIKQLEKLKVKFEKEHSENSCSIELINKINLIENAISLIKKEEIKNNSSNQNSSLICECSKSSSYFYDIFTYKKICNDCQKLKL